MTQKKQSIPQQSPFNMTKTIEEAEKALRESEDNYKYVFDYSPIGKSITQISGEIQVNQAFCRMLGYSAEELQNKKWQEITSPEDIELSQRELDALKTSKKEVARFTKRYLRKDGTILWADVSTSVRKDPLGKPMYFVTSVVDITERKEAEDALKESESLYKKMIENSPLGMHFYKLHNSDQLVFVSANPAADKLLGVDHAQFVGKTIEEAFPALVKTEVPARYRDAAAHGIPWSTEQIAYEDEQITGAFDVRAFQTMPGRMVTVFANITERKQTEDALRKNEISLQAILRSTADGILAISSDGNVIFANERFAEMWTIPQEILDSKEDAVLIQSILGQLVDPQAFLQKVQALYKSKESSFDTLYFKDGRVFERVSHPMIQDGDLRGRVWSFRDITERKQAERFLKDVISKNPMSIQVLDTNGFTLETNPAYKLLFGSVPPSDYSIFNDPQLARKGLGKNFDQLRKGKVVHFPDVYFNAHDSISELPDIPVWVRTLGFPLFDSNEKPERFILMHENVTEQKQAEILQKALYAIAQAADQAQNLNSLYPAIHTNIKEVMPADNFYIALYDEKNDLISFPYAVGEEDFEEQPHMPGKGLTEYVLRTASPALVDEVLEKELLQRDEIERVGVPSPIWLGVPLIVAGKAIGVMVVQDYKNPRAYGDREKQILEFVSSQVAIAIERKQAEDEIKQLNATLEKRVEERTYELHETQEKLVRQERLAVLGQLAGGVGHELRNPLGVINNSIYYLKMVQPDADEKINRHHDMIEHEVHNAEKIITDLLDFARVGTADRETISIPELVQRILSQFPQPASVEVSLKIPGDVPTVFADLHQTEQVLRNLIINAYQAMVSPHVDSTTGVATGKSTLTISARQEKEMVAIAIKDTGTGITPENLKKLFEPLFTTKLKGIGLGLAVSRKLIEANQGRIEVKSEAGKGSTFTVYLPVQEK